MQQENSQERCLQTTARISLVVVELLGEYFAHKHSQASVLVESVERMPLDQVVAGLNLHRPKILHRDSSSRRCQRIRKIFCVSDLVSKDTTTFGRASGHKSSGPGFKYLQM